MADRKRIPSETRTRLFSASAAHCQNPDCLAALFPAQLGGDRHIAEMAHVIPHGKAGPRHEARSADDFKPDAFENLILLCPTCHTTIDKAPESYPRALLLEWKESHFASLAKSQGIQSYETRQEVYDTISERMQDNRAIWKKYAPVDGEDFEYNPESEASLIWVHRMKSLIIPNHYRIISIIKLNLHLASDNERKIFASYKEHVRGLTEKHICEEAGQVIRFPEGMEQIFK
jgi:hypothetical protein